MIENLIDVFRRRYNTLGDEMLLIETTEETWLPRANKFITYKKEKDKAKIKFELKSVLELYKDKIIKVEVYFNPDFIEFETDLPKVEVFKM